MLTLKLWASAGGAEQHQPRGSLRIPRREENGSRAAPNRLHAVKEQSVSYLENVIRRPSQLRLHVREGRTHISRCACVCGCWCESESERGRDAGSALVCMCVSPTANVRRTAAPRNEHKPKIGKKRGPTAVVFYVYTPPPYCTRELKSAAIRFHVPPRYTGVVEQKVTKLKGVRRLCVRRRPRLSAKLGIIQTRVFPYVLVTPFRFNFSLDSNADRRMEIKAIRNSKTKDERKHILKTICSGI